MSTIKKVHAREILDSRGNPTVEVDITLSSGVVARAAVPSGASTGAFEAYELRDNGDRYMGKGVQKAVQNVNTKIGPQIIGQSILEGRKIDQLMIQLDSTPEKKNLGANAILGVSLTCARAAAMDQGVSLFKYLAGSKKMKLPIPLMNVINGGAHANNSLDVQEFMIVPVLGSFSESLRAGSEIFNTLKKIIDQKGMSTAVGDEGGFAPSLGSNKEAMEFLLWAIEKSGYKPGVNVFLALDVAATELYKNGQYKWENKSISAEELISIYSSWSKNFPLVSIEDACAEEDWAGWKKATEALGSKVKLVGDDLFVTNPKRLKQGIETQTANALLVKPNQIGTLSETQDAVSMAQAAKYITIMSHRSGETEDAIIADLAVGLACEEIKTGSLCRGERTSKYNQLLRIEEELGSEATYRALPT